MKNKYEPEWKYDINKHGDFTRYYDTENKRNYWLLGYFGGGSINILSALYLAEKFAELCKVPLSSVFIDEILSSRWCKSFKYISSSEDNQEPEPNSRHLENVYSHFRS